MWFLTFIILLSRLVLSAIKLEFLHLSLPHLGQSGLKDGLPLLL